MRSFSFSCGFASLLLLAGIASTAYAQTTPPPKERIHGLVAMGDTSWIGDAPVDAENNPTTDTISLCSNYGDITPDPNKFIGEADCTDNNYTISMLSGTSKGTNVPNAAGVFDGIVLNFGWWQLEPQQNTYDFTAIENALLRVAQYNQTYPTHPLKVRLRIWPGVQAPLWAKSITSNGVQGPINIYKADTSTTTVPMGLWWSPEYRMAWRTFLNKLASKYDNYVPTYYGQNNILNASFPEIADITNTSCSTQTDEPFIGILDSRSLKTMTDAGYSLHAYEWCLADSINDYTAWTHTTVEFPTSDFHFEIALPDGTALLPGFVSGQDYSPGSVDYGINEIFVDNDGTQIAIFPNITKNIMAQWAADPVRGPLYEPANHGLHSLQDIEAVMPPYMPTMDQHTNVYVRGTGYADSNSFFDVYPFMQNFGGSGGAVNFQTMYPLKNEIPTKAQATYPALTLNMNDAVAQAIDYNASSIELWGSLPDTSSNNKNGLRTNPNGWEHVIRSELVRWQDEFNGQTDTAE